MSFDLLAEVNVATQQPEENNNNTAASIVQWRSSLISNDTGGGGPRLSASTDVAPIQVLNTSKTVPSSLRLKSSDMGGQSSYSIDNDIEHSPPRKSI